MHFDRMKALFFHGCSWYVSLRKRTRAFMTAGSLNVAFSVTYQRCLSIALRTFHLHPSGHGPQIASGRSDYNVFLIYRETVGKWQGIWRCRAGSGPCVRDIMHYDWQHFRHKQPSGVLYTSVVVPTSNNTRVYGLTTGDYRSSKGCTNFTTRSLSECLVHLVPKNKDVIIVWRVADSKPNF